MMSLESTKVQLNNSQAILLADTFQKVRDMTRWYFSFLKEADPLKVWEINGNRLNSILWLASHIAWAENTLILKGTGGKGIDIASVALYPIKSSGEIHHPEHNMRAALDTLKLVHANAMEHLLTISDEQMEEDNAVGFNFGGEKNNRILVQHAIRHEGLHTGHLSWLCKIKWSEDGMK